jgi:hypothetical protein
MIEFYNAISSLAGGRVYPLIAPQDATYPLLVYQPVAQEKVWGVSGSHDLERVRVQVDAYAETYSEATELQDDVFMAVEGAVTSLADVRLVLTDFEQTTRMYRVTFDYTYHR